MSSVIPIKTEPEPAAVAADNERKFESLCRLVERSQGRFALALVEFDLPRLQTEILERLRARFPNLNVVTAALEPQASSAHNVLDQLKERVKQLSPERAPDALAITGLETLFKEVDADQGEELPDDAVRALQPLNLGRNILAERFPCPVLLCLPPAAMALFLRAAPDITSLRSGYFQFQSDLDAVAEELKQAAKPVSSWYLLGRSWLRKPNELSAESAKIERLIADAEALPADPGITLRLYQRLGWAAVRLHNAGQARKAFGEMSRLAREIDDQLLIKDSERGLRAAERLAPQTEISVERAEAIWRAFRGAAALTEDDGLFGREEEARQLRDLALAPEARFLTVWGETGCGKSSLALAGLLPEFKRLGQLPVIVRQWNDPQSSIRTALGRASGLSFPSSASLLDCVRQVTAETGKTVIVICDQFEQVFTLHQQRALRGPMLKAIADCVNELRVHCKFIFVIREDHMGRIAEFEKHDVREPMEQRKRFSLALFDAIDAARVMRQLSASAKLNWPDSFIRTVVADLTQDGYVRPIELQLVGAALAISGVDNELDYSLRGRAQGLLGDYLPLAINYLGRPNASVFKRILLALIAEPPGRLALKTEEIAERIGWGETIKSGSRLSAQTVSSLNRNLSLLGKAHLVRRTDESISTDKTQDESAVHYELTHDVLVDHVLALTRDLQDKRRRADRILSRGLEDQLINKRYTLSLPNTVRVMRHANQRDRTKSKAMALIRRSLLWNIFKWFAVLPTAVLLAIIFTQTSSGHITLEQDFNDRIVMRRGQSWLSVLPLIGDEIVLDTGFTRDNFEPDKRGSLQNLHHWERGNRQSGILGKTAFLDHLNSTTAEGFLLCQTGWAKEGITRLAEALRANNSSIRNEARLALVQVAQVHPQAALQPMIAILDDPNSSATDDAATVLGQIAQTDRALAGQILPRLLAALERSSISSGFSVGSGLAMAIGQVVKSDRNLAGRALEPLLGALIQKPKGAAAMLALGQIVQADSRIAGQIFQPLLVILKQSNGGNEDERLRLRAATQTLGEVVQHDRSLARQALPLLVEALKRNSLDRDSSLRSAITKSLGRIAKADTGLTRQILPHLLNVLEQRDITNDYSCYEFRAVSIALGQVVNADRNLGGSIFRPLLVKIRTAESRSADSADMGFYNTMRDAGLTLALASQADSQDALQPLIIGLKNIKEYRKQRAFETALVQIAKTTPRIILHPTLNTLKESNNNNDPDGYVRDAAARVLAQVAEADHNLARQVLLALLNALQEDIANKTAADCTTCDSIAIALGKIVQADPDLAREPLDILLNIFDRTVAGKFRYYDPRESVLIALGHVAAADPQQVGRIIPPVLSTLAKSNEVNDEWGSARIAAAATAGKIAKVNQNIRIQVFDLLTNYDGYINGSGILYYSESSIGGRLRSQLSEMVLDMAVAEMKSGRDPVQFLFDHLEGRQSLMPDRNANTFATYRKLVVGAMARWLISEDKEIVGTQETLNLKWRLQQMRDTDKRLHLRIAAWNVFAEITRLQEEKRKKEYGEDEE